MAVRITAICCIAGFGVVQVHASLPSEHQQFLPLHAELTPAEIGNAITASMQRLGYSVKQKDAADGFYQGSMKVPKDIWRRDYLLSARVSRQPDGSPALLVKAVTCRGCVVTEGDPYSPAARVNAFAGVVAQHLGVHSTGGGSPPAATGPLTFDAFFNPQIARDEPAPTGTEPAVGGGSLNTGAPGPEADASDAAPTRQEVKEPRLSIDRLAIHPAEIPPNGDFDIVYTLLVEGVAGPGGDVGVTAHYEIAGDGQTLFASQPVQLQIPPGKRVMRTEHVQAGAEAGQYIVRVRAFFGETEALSEALFRIQAKPGS